MAENEQQERTPVSGGPRTHALGAKQADRNHIKSIHHLKITNKKANTHKKLHQLIPHRAEN